LLTAGNQPFFFGKVASAALRIYTTNSTANLRARVFAVLGDSWLESSGTGSNTAPIYATYPLFDGAANSGSLLPSSGGSYLEISSAALADFVSAEYLKDGIVSLAIRMVSGSASFQTREGANKPQLVINTIEAVPPQVVSSEFDFSTSPHKLRWTFSEDVSASLSSADVVLESITNPGNVLTLSNPSYDAGSNTATFDISPAIVPDGRYAATLLASGVADAAANALLVDSPLSFFFLQGDFNHDGAVNLLDFNTLASNFGASSGAAFAQGDANYDGSVNLLDFNLLAGNFGQSVAPASIIHRDGKMFGQSRIVQDVLPA
jgi:hypothetical protein